MEAMTLSDLLDTVGDVSRKILIGNPGAQTSPTFILNTPNGIEVISTPWSGQEEKELVTYAMKLHMRNKKCTSYAFACEAWSADYPLGTDQYNIETMPSLRDDRIEVVIALANDGKKTLWRQWRIMRDEKGVCTDLRLNPFPGDADPTSDRFGNLLAPD